MTAVVVIGRTAAGKVGYAQGTYDPRRVWVWFPTEVFPNNLRMIDRDNLRPATDAETARLEFV